MRLKELEGRIKELEADNEDLWKVVNKLRVDLTEVRNIARNH